MDKVTNDDSRSLPGAAGPVPGWPMALGLAPVVAALADAWRPFPRDGLLWLDFAAVVIVAGLAFVWRGARAGQWRTPLDGHILAVLGVSIVQALAPTPGGFGMHWLRQMLACGVLYYGLVGAFRRDARALDGAWFAFAAAAVLLAGHALLGATSGLGVLARDGVTADLRWASQQGLARALLLATALTAARAAERGAAPGWRVAALMGAIGTALHVAASGLGLTAVALARFDDPLYFSSSCVLLLLIFEIMRRAWGLRRVREREAARWQMATLAFAVLAFMTAFGATLGGEGVRVLASIAAAMVVAAGEKPAAAASARTEDHVPSVARAA